MLYFIGGASRAGKSILTQRLNERYNLPWFALDDLQVGLERNLPTLRVGANVHPQAGEDAYKIQEEVLWPVIKSMAHSRLFDGRPYILEGTYLQPKAITEFQMDFPGRVRAVFLGYPTLTKTEKRTLIYDHQDHPYNWLTKMETGYIDDYLAYSVGHSQLLQQECAAAGIPFVDTRVDFEGGLALAAVALMGPPRSDLQPHPTQPAPQP